MPYVPRARPLPRVLPVPPLEQLGIGICGGRVVHRAAERIEDAAIDPRSAKYAQLLIQISRVHIAKVAHPLDAEIVQILGQARPNAGDSLQFRASGYGRHGSNSVVERKPRGRDGPGPGTKVVYGERSRHSTRDATGWVW